MKDLVISARQLRREGRLLLACLVVALVVNVVSILVYDTAWVELITTLHYTVALGLALYLVVGLVRLVATGLRRLASRNRPQPVDG